MSDIKLMIGDNEKIIWEGKPNKKCFILESIFNPMLPFALIWAAFDIFAIGLSFGASMGFFILIFLLFHMMPVWLYLGGVILAFRKYRNTQYVITDVGVYVSGGGFRYSYDMKPWAELSNISVERGIFDQKLGVGDVVFYTGEVIRGSKGKYYSQSISIINIPDYEKVFKLAKDLQRDIHADTMYPNDLRPKQNHGYQTECSNNQEKQ